MNTDQITEAGSVRNTLSSSLQPQFVPYIMTLLLYPSWKIELPSPVWHFLYLKYFELPAHPFTERPFHCCAVVTWSPCTQPKHLCSSLRLLAGTTAFQSKIILWVEQGQSLLSVTGGLILSPFAIKTIFKGSLVNSPLVWNQLAQLLSLSALLLHNPRELMSTWVLWSTFIPSYWIIWWSFGFLITEWFGSQGTLKIA